MIGLGGGVIFESLGVSVPKVIFKTILGRARTEAILAPLIRSLIRGLIRGLSAGDKGSSGAPIIKLSSKIPRLGGPEGWRTRCQQARKGLEDLRPAGKVGLESMPWHLTRTTLREVGGYSIYIYIYIYLYML